MNSKIGVGSSSSSVSAASLPAPFEQPPQARSVGPVADLIVILQEVHERLGR